MGNQTVTLDKVLVDLIAGTTDNPLGLSNGARLERHAPDRISATRLLGLGNVERQTFERLLMQAGYKITAADYVAIPGPAGEWVGTVWTIVNMTDAERAALHIETPRRKTAAERAADAGQLSIF